jgi:hypothetical protein
VIAHKLLERWGETSARDWRSWNWADDRARELVRARGAELSAFRLPKM